MKIEVSYAGDASRTGKPWEIKTPFENHKVKTVSFESVYGHGHFEDNPHNKRKAWLIFEAELEIKDCHARIYNNGVK